MNVSIIVNRTTRTIPCYTCFAQSGLAAALGRRSTAGHPRTAHRLSIDHHEATHKHPCNHTRCKQRDYKRTVHQQKETNLKSL